MIIGILGFGCEENFGHVRFSVWDARDGQDSIGQ